MCESSSSPSPSFTWPAIPSTYRMGSKMSAANLKPNASQELSAYTTGISRIRMMSPVAVVVMVVVSVVGWEDGRRGGGTIETTDSDDRHRRQTRNTDRQRGRDYAGYVCLISHTHTYVVDPVAGSCRDGGRWCGRRWRWPSMRTGQPPRRAPSRWPCLL